MEMKTSIGVSGDTASPVRHQESEAGVSSSCWSEWVPGVQHHAPKGRSRFLGCFPDDSGHHSHLGSGSQEAACSPGTAVTRRVLGRLQPPLGRLAPRSSRWAVLPPRKPWNL